MMPTPGRMAASCAFALMFGHGVAAQSLEAFAAGLELAVPENAPVVELPLPGEVYDQLTRDDLGDLRVFNAAGQAVPHGTIVLDPNAGERRFERIGAFPIDLPAGSTDDVRLTVERNERGVIRSISAEGGPSASSQRAYVLTAHRLERPYTSVTLEWRRPRKSFVHAVTLETSDDLRQWQLFSNDWLIAHLKRGSRVIRHNRITVPGLRAKYLRVRFNSHDNLPDIYSARLDVGTQSFTPQMAWTDIELSAVEEVPGRYVFDVPTGLRMRSLAITAPVEDAYARVTVRRRKAPELDWNRGSKTTVYRLRFDAGEIENKPLPVSGGPVRHWAIDVPEGGAVFDGQPPKVRIGWLRHTLVFVTRGEGPFTLAFGSATVPARVRDAAELLREVGLPARPGADGFDLPRASVVKAVPLSGPEALVVPPPPPDWKRIALWAALVVAVLVLLAIAWSLLRAVDARSANANEPSDE